MTEALLELYRHKTWATLRLIEYCQNLADEHLDATHPGTFGTVRETLHLVSAQATVSRGLIEANNEQPCHANLGHPEGQQ